eukprot:scaffold126941_cov35-Attheya_sp.AAC.1
MAQQGGSWLPGIGNAGFHPYGIPDSYMSDNYFACLWATTVILTEFIRPNALECEGPETVFRWLATIANKALRSPWIKIVLCGLPCRGKDRNTDPHVNVK